ncbi:uncharacterized protein BJX67DRAFT_380903 [Aspergillus lucknowensis]|uniref:Uncharacterized protein n=1 Tax=Aspergillus lucknowensis TaxID=176173 RepID=A0ABR4LSW6_9EURO
MKTFAILTSIAATALAQNVFVYLPEGKTLERGSEVTVQVARPNSLTGSTELAVAIGIQHCDQKNGCLPAASTLGTVLYHGGFNPQYHNHNTGLPYENFTVTVPEDTVAGKAVVGVAHAALVGASEWPFLEVVNTTATVV